MKSILHGTALACALCAGLLLATLPARAENSRKVEKAPPKLVSILGKEVTTMRDGDGGRVIDILVDAQGRIRAAVVEFGGFLGIGTRKIAVDWSAFRFSESAIQVDITREQVKALPEYKADQAPAAVKPVKN
jgi:hypothetical protein